MFDSHQWVDWYLAACIVFLGVLRYRYLYVYGRIVHEFSHSLYATR